MDFAGRLDDRDQARPGLFRDRAPETIRTGTLPDLSPERTWGGPGSGTSCAICGARLKPEEPEFELEFASTGNGTVGQGYHVHVFCFSAWERQRLGLNGAV